MTDKFYPVVSPTLLSSPCIKFYKPKFSKKRANLKFQFLKVYFPLTLFTIFKTPQMPFNQNKSKCICEQKNILESDVSGLSEIY